MRREIAFESGREKWNRKVSLSDDGTGLPGTTSRYPAGARQFRLGFHNLLISRRMYWRNRCEMQAGFAIHRKRNAYDGLPFAADSAKQLVFANLAA